MVWDMEVLLAKAIPPCQSSFEHSELCELEVHPSLCEILRSAGSLQVTRAHHKQLVLFVKLVTKYHAGPVEGHKSQPTASSGLVGWLEKRAGRLRGGGPLRLFLDVLKFLYSNSTSVGFSFVIEN